MDENGKKRNDAPRAKGMSAWLMPVVWRFWGVILLVGAISLLAAWAIPRIAIQNDLSFMLPDDNPAKMAFRAAEERFGNSGGIVIAIMSPEGIYQPELLQRVRQLATRCRELNIRIPAGELAARWRLSPEQGLALAGLLQSLSADPEFNARMLAERMANPEELAEMIGDALPAFLEIDDAEAFSQALADKLSALAASKSSLASELFAFATRTTDLYGHARNLWVDQVIALTETDSVWPEFTDHARIAAAMAPFGFSADPDLARFADMLLEAGVTRADAIQAFPVARLQKAGLSKDFLAARGHRLTPEAAAALAEAMAEAPKQIRVADLTPRAITAEAMEAIQTRLRAWPFLEKGIYAQDEKSLQVVVRTAPNLDQPNRALLLEAIKPEVSRLFGDRRYTIHMAGYGVVDEAVARLMIQDVARLFPLVIAVVVLFLYFSFRNLAGVFYPLLTVLIAVAWSIGVMSLLEVPLSAVGTAMPVLLVAVGSAYGIHLVHHFTLHPGGVAARGPAVADTLDGTGRGVVMAGLTTVAGFASLAFNRIVPLRDFGIFTALGVLFALLVSLVLIPALLLRFGVKAPAPARNPSHSAMLLHRFSRGLLGGLVNFASGHPKTVLLTVAVVLGGAAFSFSDVRVEMNNIAFFKDDSEIRRADTFINRHFAGTVDIRMIFTASEESGAIDPVVLEAMRSIGQTLQARHAQIGKTLSIVDLICKMNQAFYFNDPVYYRLPTTADLAGDRTAAALKAHLASYIDKYQRSDTRAFIDPARKEAVLILQLKTASSAVSKQILASAQELIDGPAGEGLRQKGVRVHCTGIGALYLEAEHMIVNGQLRSIAGSVLIVLVLVALIMRSLPYGLLSIMPLCVSIGINFGIMGLLDIPLDAATAISACVAIGIGIDYSLHYLNRYRMLRAEGRSHQEAAVRTAQTTGGAIVINALAVAAGFAVLLFSAFVPLIHLGFLIALTMLTSAAGALLLLPAVLSLFQKHSTPACIPKE